MQTVVWIVRLAIVLVLVWFAVKNSQDVTLTGLPGQTSQVCCQAAGDETLDCQKGQVRHWRGRAS